MSDDGPSLLGGLLPDRGGTDTVRDGNIECQQLPLVIREWGCNVVQLPKIIRNIDIQGRH
jgi:hypothetical protein